MANEKPNPFLTLSPAAVDVLDDMADHWGDRDRHGELVTELAYGPAKLAAFRELHTLVSEAWKARVNYSNVEENNA
ncbi:hypothetical protein QQY24_15800 [Streptomyces sp. TG1A-8]|uniref:hypothetical protein n=1 Tax=Streptomyces sp. TG1A-8 TaxID=3051385 RepID=UPI00265BFC4E|nr:hypothetical protein [Streptomyces sp. TG1A-8]MDO0926810.1 hypothetical protein [Streptomyces sp. TG1A-8]